MPKERFQWELRDWSDYLGNERQFIGGDHIWIEHRRLGRIWIHREGDTACSSEEEDERGREEGKQYLWVIHDPGIKQKSLTVQYSLSIASQVQHSCGRCLDLTTWHFLKKCLSLDTRYILSVLRCLNHPGLLKLRPAEWSASSPFQLSTHMHRMRWLAKWPGLFNLLTLCLVMLGRGC